jgi:hypothetical protein
VYILDIKVRTLYLKIHSAVSIRTSNIESTFRIYINLTIIMSDRCKLDLGNDRFVRACEWKGKIRIDIWEYQINVPTKKGISLTLGRWKIWAESTENINEALIKGSAYSLHLTWLEIYIAKWPKATFASIFGNIGALPTKMVLYPQRKGFVYNQRDTSN